MLKNNMARFELDLLKKIVRMVNSRTTSLDHILCMGTPFKAREDIGYQKGSSDSKPTIQKKNFRLKSTKMEELVQTFLRTGTSCPNKKDNFLKREGKEVKCYYCQKMGHIRCHCRHYKLDQNRRLRENKSIGKPT